MSEQREEENPFGFSSSNNLSNSGNPFGASGQENPFGGAAVAVDPFGFGSDNDTDAGHVVPNPFGFGAGHVVANPFDFAAAPAHDPFGFHVDEAAAAPAHVVPNPFGFGAMAAPAAGGGVVNPFGIANDGPEDNHDEDELDLSQRSVGETFLQGHMTRLAEQTSMRMSEAEKRWARELKAAVEASNDISDITDMHVAQQAIIHQGNVLNALLSIKALQEFRRIYQIQDTPEEGLQALQALSDQQPGFLLDLETNPQTQETSLVIDLRAFQPNMALAILPGKPADHSFHVLARAIYYLHKAAAPSLAAARNGLFLVVDCDNVGWDNFHTELDERLHAELLQHLPLQWKKIMAYSTALVASVWWGLSKRMFSPQFCSKLEKGCRLVDTDPSRPPRRIAEMYRQPDLKTVQARFERAAQDLFHMRETNEQDFHIPSLQAQRRL